MTQDLTKWGGRETLPVLYPVHNEVVSVLSVFIAVQYSGLPNLLAMYTLTRQRATSLHRLSEVYFKPLSVCNFVKSFPSKAIKEEARFYILLQSKSKVNGRSYYPRLEL